MTLIAPEHIRGRLTRFTPEALRQERADWAAKARKDGHSVHEISEALGVNRQRVYDLVKLGGFTHTPPPVIGRDTSRFGLSVGAIGNHLPKMPKDAQDRLVRDASRTGRSFAEILVQHWIEK